MDKQETGNRLLPGVNPNINRGPYCVICGVEMNRPNHRFPAAILEDGSVRVTRFRGELSSAWNPSAARSTCKSGSPAGPREPNLSWQFAPDF